MRIFWSICFILSAVIVNAADTLGIINSDSSSVKNETSLHIYDERLSVLDANTPMDLSYNE